MLVIVDNANRRSNKRMRREWAIEIVWRAGNEGCL